VSNHLKNLKLKIWRQSGPTEKGHFEEYVMREISDEASFLEMLDVLNEGLIGENKLPVVFDHDLSLIHISEPTRQP
jgi:succinate dehydrogenase / fumarate reductase iron-sulfur subunit